MNFVTNVLLLHGTIIAGYWRISRLQLHTLSGGVEVDAGLNSGGDAGACRQQPRRAFHHSSSTVSRRTTLPCQNHPIDYAREFSDAAGLSHSSSYQMNPGLSEVKMGRNRPDSWRCLPLPNPTPIFAP
jgi:hypothetical protein